MMSISWSHRSLLPRKSLGFGPIIWTNCGISGETWRMNWRLMTWGQRLLSSTYVDKLWQSFQHSKQILFWWLWVQELQDRHRNFNRNVVENLWSGKSFYELWAFKKGSRFCSMHFQFSTVFRSKVPSRGYLWAASVAAISHDETSGINKNGLGREFLTKLSVSSRQRGFRIC